MYNYGAPLNDLINQLNHLPGIGQKMALRLAFYIINQPLEYAAALSDTIYKAKKNLLYCSMCQNITDTDPCPLCKSPNRDKHIIMVVSDPRDMWAYERTNSYKGLYHILHGCLSTIDGITPDMLKIPELLKRLSDDAIKEIILATNPNVEGEATAMYINKIIKPIYGDLLITRIARGVPVGGDIEYADTITLARALSGRMEM